MTTTDQFAEVIRTEADLAEAILAALRDQQEALVHFRNKDLVSAVERQQRLLVPMEELERERINLSRSLSDGSNEFSTLSSIAAHSPSERAVSLLETGARLREKAENIMVVSRQNRALLEHSLRFVKHTLRIMTENYARKLVDTTM